MAGTGAGKPAPYKSIPLVAAVHTAVPGRGRYRVEVLYHSETLKELLENRLQEQEGIEQVSANPLTGNVLVLFNHNHSARSVAALIEKAARDAIASERTAPASSSNGKLATIATGNHRKPIPARGSGVSRPKHERTGKGQAEEPWHLMEPAAVLAAWKTSPRAGLPEQEVHERRQNYGPNVLPEAEPRSQLSILLDQLGSWPVAMLSAAAGISILTGGVADAIAIMGVVAINTAIGYFTESGSENTIRSLKNITKPPVPVVRDGKLKEVAAENMVSFRQACVN